MLHCTCGLSNLRNAQLARAAFANALHAIAMQSHSEADIELQAWASGNAQPHAPMLPDTESEDCNFDADSFRLVHCRVSGPVPAQVRRLQSVNVR